MTGKARMLKALRFDQPDRPPHFETMFELEQEAFGLKFPQPESWADCSRREKQRKIATCMEIYRRIVERYRWDALAVYWPWSDPDGVRAARETFGGDILIGAMVGHSIWAIESVADWEQFALDLMHNPAAVLREAERRCRQALGHIDRLLDAGAEFINLVNDVGFNSGPFISPGHFRRFVTPYLARQVRHIRERGAFAFVHSDGMVMPVLEDLLVAPL